MSDVLDAAAAADLPLTQRLVLVWYARRAGLNLEAWPSVADVCYGTGLSRRACLKAIGELRALGWLVPAGLRGQIVAYRLELPGPSDAEQLTSIAQNEGSHTGAPGAPVHQAHPRSARRTPSPRSRRSSVDTSAPRAPVQDVHDISAPGAPVETRAPDAPVQDVHGTGAPHAPPPCTTCTTPVHHVHPEVDNEVDREVDSEDTHNTRVCVASDEGQASNILAVWNDLASAAGQTAADPAVAGHVVTALRKHGRAEVLAGVRWWWTSDHRRARWLREQRLPLTTLLTRLPEYLELERQSPADLGRGTHPARPPRGAAPSADDLAAFAALDVPVTAAVMP